MSPKSRIIDALTLCLKQKSNKDFKLNKSAAYTGLADLYEHYALESNPDQFFEAFEQLCKIPDDYRLGDNPILDNFIIQLEKVFHPQKPGKKLLALPHGGKLSENPCLPLQRRIHLVMYIIAPHK